MPDISDVRIHLMVDNAQALAGMRTTEAAVRSSATRMGASMTHVAQTMNRAGIQMQSLGRYMTTFVSLPLAALGVVATKSALDFQKTFLKIQTLATGVGMSMDEAKAKVLEFAHALGQDPQEMAEGLYFVASAGLENAKNVFPVLEQAAKAAAVGLGDTGTVAQLLTSAMNAYAKSGLEAATATEILAEAVAQGKAEPAEFAQYLGSVIPVAAQMGVSFDQVAGAVANATTYGVDAARAVTGLRYALSSLANPTDAAKEVLKDYNITVEQVQDSLAKPNGLLDTYTMLADTFDLQTTKGKEAWQTVIGGARASIIVNTLVGENAEQTARIMEQMGLAAEGATGRMERAWNKFERSDAFKFEQAKADLKAAMIDLGNVIIPIIVEDIIPVVKDLIEWWDNLSDSAKQSAVKWGMWAIVAGPVLMTLGTILRLVSSIVSIGAGLAGTGGIANMLGLGAGGVASLGAGVTALLGIAAALGSIYLAYKVLTGADPTFVPELGSALADLIRMEPELQGLEQAIMEVAGVGTAARAEVFNNLMEGLFPEGYTNEAKKFEARVKGIVDEIYSYGGALTKLEQQQFRNLAVTGNWDLALAILKARLQTTRGHVEDLNTSISELPSSKTIEIIADTKDATTSVQGFLNWVNALGPQSITIAARLYKTDVAEGWTPPPQGKNTAATGGILTARAGLITTRPTVLVGEGSYSTFAGKGAEAVIPLDGRGIGILAEALARAGARSRGDRTIVVNVAGKIERPEDLRRELAWWERTRGW